MDYIFLKLAHSKAILLFCMRFIYTVAEMRRIYNVIEFTNFSGNAICAGVLREAMYNYPCSK